jgi:hypothetical protein
MHVWLKYKFILKILLNGLLWIIRNCGWTGIQLLEELRLFEQDFPSGS